MYLIKKILLLTNCTFILLLFAGCSGFTSVRKHDLMEHDTKKREILYKDFWEAASNFDFRYLESQNLKQEEKEFIRGLKYIFNCEMAEAEKVFSNLRKTTKDSLMLFSSTKVLIDLLFFQSKWKDILSVDSTGMIVRDTLANTEALIQAFSQIPPERYIFNKDSCDLPFSLSPTGCPIIEIYINGTKRYLWIDTGANYCVLSSGIANECRIYPVIYEKSKALTATIMKVDIYPAMIDSCRLGSLEGFNIPVVIVSETDLRFQFFGSSNITKIDGILGWKALQNIDILIDYRNMRIKIYKPRKIQNPDRNFFWLGCPIVKTAGTDGTELIFGLDNGSERTTITPNIFTKISFEKIYSLTTRLGSVGGWIFNNSRMVSDLTINLTGYNVEFKDIGTGYQLKKLFAQLDGILGSDFMTNCQIRLDWLNGRFVYEPY